MMPDNRWNDLTLTISTEESAKRRAGVGIVRGDQNFLGDKKT